MPFDSHDFRRQLYWRFENFRTAELSYDLYAQTFRDVNPAKSIFFNPFNHAYYNAVFKGIAGGGNCFGMCLKMVYAQVGRSSFAEPISRFGPDGDEPEPCPSDKALIEEINLKHAYQTGAECIDYFLGQFALGRTHDPKDAAERSRDMFLRGDYPVMVVTNATFKVGGHVVRPYAWDSSNPSRWVMKIADPNVPSPIKANDLDRRCIIEIDPRSNNSARLQGRQGGPLDRERLDWRPDVSGAVLGALPRTAHAVLGGPRAVRAGHDHHPRRGWQFRTDHRPGWANVLRAEPGWTADALGADPAQFRHAHPADGASSRCSRRAPRPRSTTWVGRTNAACDTRSAAARRVNIVGPCIRRWLRWRLPRRPRAAGARPCPRPA